MFRIFFVGLIFICISCSTESKVEYEYITKNKSFVDNLNIESNSAFVNLSDGFTFYSQDNEDVTSIPVLLIHGFSVPSYIWDPTFVLLSKQGYRVISLDLYGRGFSQNIDSAYTDKLLANQVIELMKNLEIDSAKLIGLSNGGRVISKVAELRPEMVHSLIYVASSGFRLINEVEDKSVTEKEEEEFINNRYPTISKGQLADFKYPENLSLIHI